MHLFVINILEERGPIKLFVDAAGDMEEDDNGLTAVSLSQC